MNLFFSRSENGTKSLAKIKLLPIFLLPVILILLSACRHRAHITLRLAGDDWFLKTLTDTRMIPEFEEQSGFRVFVVRENDKKIMSELDRGAQAGEPGLDIVVVRHRWLGTLVKKGQVQPIDSFLSDSTLHDPKFVPQQQLFGNWWRELSSYDNQTYGFPFTGLTTLLCYRKDLIEDVGNQRDFQGRYHRELKPPSTWQEYNQLAEFFNRPKDGFYGTYIQGKQGLALWYEWLNLIYAFGGNILDTQHGWEYGDIVVNSPQNVAATKEYVQLKAFSPPDTLKFGWMEAQSSLQKGNVFMGLLWSDQAPFLEDPAESKVAGKIGYSLIPSSPGPPFSQMEGLTYLIPTQSQHARAAYRFLEWLMSSQLQTEQTLEGSGSLRQSVYENPEVKKLPYTAAFLASIPVAKAKPIVPEADETIAAMEVRVSEIVSGQSPAQAGLDKLALDLQRVLGGKAKLRYPPRGK
jgi:multiple sugar transport system substrate-binding protein